MALFVKRVPILEWLPKYNITFFLQDLLAGFTVALTEIPQGIAFALIAGLSPEYGLYCSFMGGFVYAVFGSCKDVNIGPTSILALMIQGHVTRLGPDMAVIITFLGGIVIFVFGVLNLGFVVEFFSYPVISGFTCAASLQIASSQLKSLFGIKGPTNAFLESWKLLFRNWSQIKKWDSILGICSILFLVLFKEIRRFGTLQYRQDWSKTRNVIGVILFMLSLARNALVVILGGLISYHFRNHAPFIIIGEVKGNFPPFGTPSFTITKNGTLYYNFGDIINDYGPSLIFIPLVAILEAISIGKAFSKGKPLDATQEMLALGLCNIMGSFVRSMPITGSFTRTAVNNASGVKTTLAGVITSLMVLLAIPFLTPSFYYVPKTTLASVIITAMFYLFDFDAIGLLYRSKKLELVPFLGTLVFCLFVGLEYGILIGISLNLIFVLYASARPKLTVKQETIPGNSGDVFVIRPRDTLFFPAADFLRNTVLKCQGSKDKNAVIVIDGENVRNVDVTVAKTLANLSQEVGLRAQKIVLLNFKASVMKICIQVDRNLGSFFKNGDLNVILDEQSSGLFSMQ